MYVIPRLDIALDDYEGMLDFKAIDVSTSWEVISLSRKRDITED